MHIGAAVLGCIAYACYARDLGKTWERYYPAHFVGPSHIGESRGAVAYDASNPLGALGTLLLHRLPAPIVNAQVHNSRSTPRFHRTAGVRASISAEHLIKDMQLLEPLRFVVQGKGAILEAVGTIGDLGSKKEGVLTFSNDDKSFECHLKLAELREAEFVKKESPNGQMLHIIRILGDGGESLISAILHPEEGEDAVDAETIGFWEKLKTKLGEKVELSATE